MRLPHADTCRTAIQSWRSAVIVLASFVPLLLSGCATTCCGVPTAPLVTAPNKITAVGYGNPGSYTHYTHSQQKLMAIRAAQVDAYRNLAERIYGFRVSGATAVSAFATQNDSVRSYVDAFIRGARVINTATIADGNVEVTVELDVTPQFLNCVAFQRCTTSGEFPVSSVSLGAGCQAYGCAQPSSIYFSY